MSWAEVMRRAGRKPIPIVHEQARCQDCGEFCEFGPVCEHCCYKAIKEHREMERDKTIEEINSLSGGMFFVEMIDDKPLKEVYMRVTFPQPYIPKIKVKQMIEKWKQDRIGDIRGYKDWALLSKEVQFMVDGVTTFVDDLKEELDKGVLERG